VVDVILTIKYIIVRFETDVISVRLGRSLSRQELLMLTQLELATDASKRSPATAAVVSIAPASASPVQWKFLCIEGYISPLKTLASGVRFSGLVVSALGIRTRGPGFDSQVAPLFHWVATLGKLFTHTASPVSQLQETGVQKGRFRRLSDYGIKCTRLS